VPVDDRPSNRYDEEEDYDLSPDEDDLDGLDDLEDESEEDELDDLADPRITEVDSEEEAPKLVQPKGKGKKRPADTEEEVAGLDEIIGKSLKNAANGEATLSKKQMKKLKNNAGQPVTAVIETETKITKEGPSGKKVQFAKQLEQGPTKSEPKKTEKASKDDKKTETKKEEDKPKAAGGVRKVQGVTVDDRKAGKGPAAKKGSKISMRYIGKLTDGKVFDGIYLPTSMK
jgi:FK506-binding nuclear protein